MTPITFLSALPTLAFLYLILKSKKFNFLLVILALIYILLADLLVGNILNLSLNFDPNHTIFSIKEVQNAIYTHQQEALYLPYKLRLLIFNNLIYLYYIFSHAVTFFSLASLNNTLLLINLYPLTLGILSLSTHTQLQKGFILGSFFITLLILGLSRSVVEANFFIVISPLLLYLIFLGLKKANLKLYLALLILNLIVQIKIYE